MTSDDYNATLPRLVSDLRETINRVIDAIEEASAPDRSPFSACGSVKYVSIGLPLVADLHKGLLRLGIEKVREVANSIIEKIDKVVSYQDAVDFGEYQPGTDVDMETEVMNAGYWALKLARDIYNGILELEGVVFPGVNRRRAATRTNSDPPSHPFAYYPRDPNWTYRRIGLRRDAPRPGDRIIADEDKDHVSDLVYWLSESGKILSQAFDGFDNSGLDPSQITILLGRLPHHKENLKTATAYLNRL